MTGFDAFAAVALMFLWLGLGLLTQRLRRDTVGKAERDEFKTRLPSWVAQLESYSFIVIFTGASIAGCVSLFRLHAAH